MAFLYVAVTADSAGGRCNDAPLEPVMMAPPRDDAPPAPAEKHRAAEKRSAAERSTAMLHPKIESTGCLYQVPLSRREDDRMRCVV